MGLCIANYLSLSLGYLDKQSFEYMHKILSRNLSSYKIENNILGASLDALSRDKKNVGNNLVCILTNDPGSMKKEKIPMDAKL